MANTLINPLYPRPHYPAGGGSIASGSMLTVSSSSSATSFTTSNFDSGVELVFFDIQTNNVIVTFDGTTPSSGTRGHVFIAGTNYTMQLATVLNAKFTTTAATATAVIFASQFAM